MYRLWLIVIPFLVLPQGVFRVQREHRPVSSFPVSSATAFLSLGGIALHSAVADELLMPSASAAITNTGQYEGHTVQARAVGNLVYVVGRGRGLQIIDVSVPERPTLQGSYVPPSMDTVYVEVRGTLAYVGYAGNDANYKYVTGTHIVDVSDPEYPTLRGSYAFLAGFTVVGDYAYGARNGQFEVVDVRDPQQPMVRGICSVQGDTISIAVEGNFAYVAAVDQAYGGFQIIDISDQTQPVVRGNSFGIYITPVDMSVTNGVLYLTTNARYTKGEVHIIDVRNPEEPVGLGMYRLSGQTAASIAVRGTIAYVGKINYDSGQGQLLLLDTSDPANPQLVDSLPSPIAINDIELMGPFIYVATSKGLQILGPNPLYKVFLPLIQAHISPKSQNTNSS